MILEWLKQKEQDYLAQIQNRKEDIKDMKERILSSEAHITNYNYAIAELHVVINAAEYALHEHGMDVERC